MSNAPWWGWRIAFFVGVLFGTICFLHNQWIYDHWIGPKATSISSATITTISIALNIWTVSWLATTPHLGLVFSEDTNFTLQRKVRIDQTFSSFQHYLTRIGFDPPKRIPPIQILHMVDQGVGIVGSGDNPYATSLFIGVEAMDSKASIGQLYAKFFINLVLCKGDRLSLCKQASIWIISSYFSDSFLCPYFNHASPPEFMEWNSVLRGLHDHLGKSFMDRAMFFTVQLFDDTSTVEGDNLDNLNEYFEERLKRGLRIMDNPGTRWVTKLNELKSVFIKKGNQDTNS